MKITRACDYTIRALVYMAQHPMGTAFMRSDMNIFSVFLLNQPAHLSTFYGHSMTGHNSSQPARQGSYSSYGNSIYAF